jgi:hypothetical protein
VLVDKFDAPSAVEVVNVLGAKAEPEKNLDKSFVLGYVSSG